jgi:peptidyl-dipeptidase Dcp
MAAANNPGHDTVPPQSNPLLADWNTPFGMPPFDQIRPEHFVPAFTAALAAHLAEIDAIAGNPAAPSFENTIEAMERGGRALDKVSSVFFGLSGAHTNDALQAIEREMSPKLAAHGNAIRLNDALYRRIDALWQQRDQLGLAPEQARVLERYHTSFRRAGAGLPKDKKDRLAAITERLASLGTEFSQHVLADEQNWTLTLDSEDDLAGLPDFLRTAAAEAAKERKQDGKYAITLSRSSVEPFLQSSRRRDLREKAWRAWIARGDNGDKNDNNAIIAETVALRAERAKLLGYENFAQYRHDDAMAKTPANVRNLLERVWPAARKRALADRDAMQEIVREEGGNFKLAAWDWRYYAEKLRKAHFDLDEAEIKPYLSLDNVIAAAFDCAGKLFGLKFEARKDIPVWHPDVRCFEVKDAAGRHVGLFFGDYFARSSKRSGAWMSSLRDQNKLDGETRPIIYNVMNFAKAPDGQPTLLSFDDARTLFHELGHGLHGLLSDVTYPSICCTRVATDFVELPSQLYEHWLERPEVLRKFARHHQTGEPMPDALLQKLIAARTFNQGFQTVEYVASALVDLDFHELSSADSPDVDAFEKKSLDKIGMPEEISMRHRPTHFTHVFSGGGYAAAYYSYMWSEVLDADAFDAFAETGNDFDPATAKRLKEFIYAAGNSRDPAEAYTQFRGRLPTVDALLKKRGLVDEAA